MDYIGFTTVNGDQVDINPEHVMAVVSQLRDGPKPRTQIVLIGGLSYTVEKPRADVLRALGALA